ncbi:uncharacterized protein [Anoplolepis gracilipes]|uniref:uncharacterized protein n=1 Tax=Anoplolepis gracilipes TaxID=354296 RepID=UPI003BA09D32
MWKASVILNVLAALTVTRLTEADYYKYNRNQYKQSATRFKCTEEGYHADPYDCRVYYRCVDWGNNSPLTLFKFECGVGTVFSKNQGDICTHPGDSGRLECAGSENELDSNLHDSSEIPSPIWTTTMKTTTRPQQTTTQFTVTTRQPTITQAATTTREPETAQSSLTSRPTTDQPENNCRNKLECTQEDFLADTCDCRKFYRCVDEGYGKFKKYEFTCGLGTVWDPEIQGCNHAWAVTKGSCRQNLESEDNTNNDGQWHGDVGDNDGQWNGNTGSADQSGQSGQAGDPNNQLEQPDQPENPDGQPGSSGMPDSSGYPGIPSTPSSSGLPGYPGMPDSPGTSGSPGTPGAPGFPSNPDFPGYPETSNSPDLPESPETSELPETPSTPNKPDSPNAPCSPGTSETSGSPSHQPSTDDCTKEGFFAHPNDCRKFYRCVNNGNSFTKYEFQCGVGTVWDSSIESCNHVYAVPHCSHTGDIITNQPDTSLNEVDSTDRLDTSELPPVQSPESSTVPSISSKPEISSSTQEAESTNKPIIPSQTTSVSYLPPATQMTTSISYLPPSSTATTEATSGSTPESVSYLPPSTSTDTGPTTSTSSSSISSAISSSQTGKHECNEEGFFPNPNNCKKFYRCVQGQSGYQKYEFECGPGTAWDQSVQTCNYIEQVSSCSIENNEIDQGSTTTASSQITATTSSSVIPTSTTVASIPETSTEPSMPEENKTEVSSTTITSAGEKPVSEEPEEIQKPESSSTENSSESSSEQSSSESSEGSSSSTESHVPDCTTQKLNNTIVCNNEGFYPHPVQCDKFYRCVDNGNGFNVYHFDCAPGTIFDPSISVCNYPESVYPARDCATASTTTSSNVEQTTESETSEQSVSTTTTTTTASTTTMSTETTTLEESTESTTESTESTESEKPTTESQGTTETESQEQSTTESQEQSTTESSTTEAEEQSTTESQEQSTTESSTTEAEEQSTTESQEQSTTESQEQSTTESQEQSTTESSEQTTAAEPAAAAPCTIGNLTDNQITLVCPTGFRRHPKYCNLFYQCTSEENMEIKILVLGCPENTIFDEKKIQCLPEDESSDPCTGAKASVRLYRRVENNALSPVKVSSNQLCPEEGHFPYRQGCSNNFYKCKRDIRNNLQGYFYKCPENFVYWSISRRCEHVMRLPMCSHLTYRNKTDWNDRWQIPTEDFNLSTTMLRFL